MSKWLGSFIGILFFLISVTSVWPAEELTWQDCLREAAHNHPDLIAAQEEVIQDQAAKTVTASILYPQVTADLNASNSKSNQTGSSNSFNYGLSGTFLLFDGFKTINNVHAAGETVKAARENFKFTSATVRFRLRTAFIDLLKAQQLVELSQEIYKIRKSNLELISLRYQSGTEHKGALLTAQANLSEATYEINQAKRAVEVAQRQLVKELGRAHFSPLTAKGSFDVSAPDSTTPNFESITQKNSSLLKISAQKNAAAFDTKASEGDFWPTISVDGDVNKSGSRWPPGEHETSAGVRVSLPLFEGGARLAQVAKAKSFYRQLEQQERSTKDGIILSLQQDWNNWQDAVEQVTVQQNFLNAAEERSKIAQQQYSVGLISFDNWTIIEDDLVRNKNAFLDAQANAFLAEANWIQVKGETIEYEN